jgi:hypothetical protein
MTPSPGALGRTCWLLLSLHVAPSHRLSIHSMQFIRVDLLPGTPDIQYLFTWNVIHSIGLPRTFGRSFLQSQWLFFHTTIVLHHGNIVCSGLLFNQFIPAVPMASVVTPRFIVVCGDSLLLFILPVVLASRFIDSLSFG